MRSKRSKSSITKERSCSMEEQNVLAIDVAKGKSMVSLISSCGEVLIEPYEINHTFNDLNKLNERIKKLGVNKNTSIILEATGIYGMPIKRFFLEKDYKLYIINPVYSKMYKQNLRKTKTDKEDCLKLAELFFMKDFRRYIQPEQFYLNLNAMSREYNCLIEKIVSLKIRFRELLYLTFPEYENVFKGKLVFSDTSLEFIGKYLHADIIKKTRVDALANTMATFNKRHPGYYLKKAKLIKEYAINSYPSVSKEDQIVDNLSITIKLLKIYLNEIDQLKNKLIDNAKKSYMFEPIKSILGMGELGTSLVIAELGDISRFNNIKQLTAYCGLDPSIKQSGKSINIHGPISKSGNKYIRRVLFNCVIAIIKVASNVDLNNDILVYYRKKRNEGKHHYVASVACMTKLLRKIFALCKNASNNM